MADATPWPAGLVEAYPSLAALPPAPGPQPWQAMSVPAGTLLFEEHAPCRGFCCCRPPASSGGWHPTPSAASSAASSPTAGPT